MSVQKKVEYQGRIVDAELVEYTEKANEWSSYKLEDGSTIKVRPIVSNIMRLIGEYKETGEPVYILNTALVIAADVAENLMKPKP